MNNTVAGNPRLALPRGKEVVSRKAVMAAFLAVALLAFEIFNFDTTQFALENLLGSVRFAGVMWATILAIAFCAIDFAGLVRLFTPQRGREEPRAVWFMTGAWLLGTIANAVLTWWAVSLTLLSHEFGNEVLSREELLRFVPIFVAMLVWLTRILFIGAFSVTGEEIIGVNQGRSAKDQDSARALSSAALPASTATGKQATRQGSAGRATNGQPQKPTSGASRPAAPAITYEPIDDVASNAQVAPRTDGSIGPSRPTSRIQQRPPMPGSPHRTPSSGNVQAKTGGSGH